MASPDVNAGQPINKAPSTTIPKPVSGPTSTPPTQVGRDQEGAMKEAAPTEVNAAQAMDEMPIEQQIK